MRRTQMSSSMDGRDEESPFISEPKSDGKYSRPRRSRIFDIPLALVLPWTLIVILSITVSILVLRTHNAEQIESWSTTDFGSSYNLALKCLY